MKYLFAFIAVLAALSGCSGGSSSNANSNQQDEQPQNLSLAERLTNGSSASNQNSYWECAAGDIGFDNSFFNDGTGTSEARTPGARDSTFTWVVTSEDSVNFDFEGEVFGLFDFLFNSDNLNFTAEDTRGPLVSCDRILL